MGLLGTLGTIGGSFFGPQGAMIGGLIGGALDGSDAAGSASQAQQQSAQQGSDFQREMFNRTQGNLQPYMQAGHNAMGYMNPYMQAGAPGLRGQQDLIGMNGAGAQSGAISAIANSPLLQQLTQQGENALLQNASATGGLRGGNLQGALAQYRPAMLQQAIDQQYARLGGMTSLGQMSAQNMAQMGQSAAAGVGTAGMNTANQVAGLYGQQGAAQAGGILAQNNAMNQGVMGALGAYGGYGGFGSNSGAGLSGMQAAFSNTSLGGSGFGSGMAYGNQDLGAFL